MFKLRIWDRHVHAVAATDPEGEPFDGPGVDLRGEAADRAFEAAQPLWDLLHQLEPGIRVRSLSLHLERPRLLATLEPTTPEADDRPRVIRLDSSSGWAMEAAIEAAGPVTAYLETRAAEALRRRRQAGTGPIAGDGSGGVV